MSEVQRAVLVRITGRVQGVWFRDWTKQKADALGLAGWVRNRSDKSVEAYFTGQSDLVDIMIAKCGQGPILSSVDEVLVSEQERAEEGAQADFEIRL